MPIERAFVVHGEPGWDEATPAGDFVLYDVHPGSVVETTRTPEDYGSTLRAGSLAGGDAEHNARELIRVFTGEDKGAHRDALLMGTSLVLEVQGVAKDPVDGVEQAAAAIDDGGAESFLGRLKAHFRDVMSDFLKSMATSSAARAAMAPSFTDADFDKPVVPLSLGSFDVIAEIKQRSPAEGQLRYRTPYSRVQVPVDLIARAQAYAAGGAAAISVLTEPSRFDGELAHLEEVVAAVPDTPVMRKDFLVEPVQVLEARKAGASGVLLITTMLSDAKLRAMLDCAFEHGMFVLLESFDEEDLRRSAASSRR